MERDAAFDNFSDGELITHIAWCRNNPNHPQVTEQYLLRAYAELFRRQHCS